MNMNLITPYIQKFPNSIKFFSLPENGIIQMKITVRDIVEGQFTYFCSLDENMDPILHLTLRKGLLGYHPVIGKFDHSCQQWKHAETESDIIILDEETPLEIYYGSFRNDIFVGGTKSNSVGHDLSFKVREGAFISFGDLKNEGCLVPKEGIVEIKHFKIKEIYRNGKNSCVYDVLQPKALDNESVGIFKKEHQ